MMCLMSAIGAYASSDRIAKLAMVEEYEELKDSSDM